ncbi:hypothetical protein AMS68_007091 [Peltaster fructicola]|uniref:Uncharacterized protein n=1 Tax=Peltaster fructicola TaxID=286661 RepID=A0A6H0Y3I1_9PEZI|nr:hypothetical protein AMS68_007091 [Peltaster fructicola]
MAVSEIPCTHEASVTTRTLHGEYKSEQAVLTVQGLLARCQQAGTAQDETNGAAIDILTGTDLHKDEPQHK